MLLVALAGASYQEIGCGYVVVPIAAKPDFTLLFLAPPPIKSLSSSTQVKPLSWMDLSLNLLPSATRRGNPTAPFRRAIMCIVPSRRFLLSGLPFTAGSINLAPNGLLYLLPH